MKKITAIAVALLMTSHLFAQRDYSSLHDMLIKFYGYQRAGLKSGSCHNLNSNFRDAAHGGDNYNGKPLDGGWYDAGDYIKFGMNLGYSVYCLLKGYDVFPSVYTDKYKWDHSSGADGIPDILNQVKFATDYICKAVIDKNTVILDVGDAASEHNTWGVVNGSGRNGRPCNGGDIPATYAACLALMSTVYREFNEAYADSCLEKAKVAFAFAKSKFNSGNNYCTPQGNFYDYPTVEGKKNMQINDRMVAAGVELYRATNDGDPSYKTWAMQGITDFYNCVGYAYIGPLASIEVWRQTLGGASSLISNLGFIENHVKESGAFKNIYQNSDWGTARDAGSAAFEYALGFIVSKNDETRDKYKQRVIDHVDWTGGYGGGQSYICGVNGGPTSIHYRTTNYGAVPGAVVSGPKGDGSWQNDGTKYDFTEVAIDYNAGIIGAVAFLKALSSSTDTKMSKGFEATPSSDVDLNSQTVKFSGTFSKTAEWTITIIGGVGSKTLTGNGTSINATWDGSADKGCFLAGEIVRAALNVKGGISALDLQRATPIPITIAKTKVSPPKPGDVLVDNFEDSDSANNVGGYWKAFGTGTGLKITTSTFSTQDGSVALQLSGNVVSSDEASYAGIRSYFKSDKTPCAIGPVKSVVFDLKASNPVNVSVELEQSDITDGAYHGIVIPISDLTNNYRLDVADFNQPDWATSSVPLDLNKMTALRFTIYDSTGLIKLYLDNVSMEDLKIGTSIASASGSLEFSLFKPMVSNGNLIYSIPWNTTGATQLTVFNVSGKIVMKQKLAAKAGETARITLSHIPAGMYFANFISCEKNGRQVMQQFAVTVVR